MTKLFGKFINDESGATAIEYGLIAALIAMAIIAGAGMLGNSINDKFVKISGKLNTSGDDHLN
jgi:pilus assembly protein Flp/PilA